MSEESKIFLGGVDPLLASLPFLVHMPHICFEFSMTPSIIVKVVIVIVPKKYYKRSIIILFSYLMMIISVVC